MGSTSTCVDNPVAGERANDSKLYIFVIEHKANTYIKHSTPRIGSLFKVDPHSNI